jgi:hypothetical protein
MITEYTSKMPHLPHNPNSLAGAPVSSTLARVQREGTCFPTSDRAIWRVWWSSCDCKGHTTDVLTDMVEMLVDGTSSGIKTLDSKLYYSP